MKHKDDGLIKFGICFVAFWVAGIPTWLWLLIYKFVTPEGFWEKFALVGGGLWVFGSLQLVLFMCFLVFIWNVIFD